MSAAVSDDDWREITLMAIGLAKAGDDKARSWLSNYLIGAPRQQVDLDARIATPAEWLAELGMMDEDADTCDGVGK